MLVRARGEEWTVSLRTLHTDCTAVRLRGCGRNSSAHARTLLSPFDQLTPIPTSGRLQVVTPQGWLRHTARAFVSAAPFGSLPAAAHADIRLLPFQFEPALAMLRHARLRVLIADEVGLGKTIQAGILLAQLSIEVEGLRALLLTPAGVREQWRHELRTRFGLEPALADAAWLLERSRDLPPDVNPWSLPGIYISSLDLVKRPEVLRSLEEVAWDLCVVDEAHGAAPGTARLAAAHAAAHSARRVLLLTATPPDGEPARMAALAGIGRHDAGEPLTEFRRTRAGTGVGGRRKSVLLPVRLTRAEREMHRALERYTAMVWSEAGARQDARARLAAIILRKRALSSAASLALSTYRRLALLGMAPAVEDQQLLLPLLDEDPLDDELSDQVLGASGLSDVRVERGLLDALAALAERAARSESKMALLRRLLDRAGEPAIVFTEYRDTLARIAAALAPRPTLLMHGGMTPHDRHAVQEAFNRDGGVLLATDAASEGLNLHERCRLVVHFELPWTPARLEQRTGRVDRLGQLRRVHEVTLVARDTCERLVLSPLARRARAAAVRTGQNRRAMLSESAVAAAVMEGVVPQELPDPEAAATVAMDLRDEAAAEAWRLDACRRFGSRLTAESHRSGSLDVAVAIDSEAPEGAALVVTELALLHEDGRRLHAQLLPVTLEIAGEIPHRRAAQLRGTAARLLDAGEARILAEAERHGRVTVQSIRERIAAASRTAAWREQALARRAPSAAQRLVQVGLFDARGIRALASRRHNAALIRLETDERLAALAQDRPLRTRCRIVAIRFGTGRRR